MTDTPSVKRCGAQTKAGTPCQRTAGTGTDHVGYGKCKLHGGCSPSGKAAAAKEKTIALGRQYAVSELPIDPMEAMLSGVRLAAGIRASYLADLEGVGDDAKRYEYLRLELRRANRELVQASEATIRAGVAERYVRAAERIGDLVAAAFEDGLSVLAEALGVEVLTVELRKRALGRALSRLESFEAVEGTATEIPR